MNFEVTEIKSLGKSIGKRLSIRLEAVQDANTAYTQGSEPETLYTIHAILPAGREFEQVKIGDVFNFESRSDEICQDSACVNGNILTHKFGQGCRLFRVG